MNDFDRTHENDSEIDRLAEALGEQRPQLTALELDRVRSEIHRRTSARPQLKGSVMKSRLAAVLIVTMGVFTSGSGIALGVDAISSDNSAARGEYGDADAQCDPAIEECQDVLGVSGGGANGDQAGAAGDPGTQAATATKSGGTLPFTGYLAIPILLIGVVLTITGLAMRRRLGSNQLS